MSDDYGPYGSGLDGYEDSHYVVCIFTYTQILTIILILSDTWILNYEPERYETADAFWCKESILGALFQVRSEFYYER